MEPATTSVHVAGNTLYKRIVERHGGIIDATGEEDKGACFKVQLPVKQERPQ